MARTLFFLEAILLLLGSGLLASLGPAGLEGLLVPAAVSILIPLASLCSVWPLPKLARAFAQAFSSGRPGLGARESRAILGALEGFTGLGALAGALGEGIVLLRSPGAGADPRALTFQVLAFGLFGALYGLGARILRDVVHRAREIPANSDLGPGFGGFAAKYGLSPREAEVATLMAEGRSYQEVAEVLFISIKTVKTHISRVYAKTECPNKVSLVLLLRAETGESYGWPMAEKGGGGED